MTHLAMKFQHFEERQEVVSGASGCSVIRSWLGPEDPVGVIVLGFGVLVVCGVGCGVRVGMCVVNSDIRAMVVAMETATHTSLTSGSKLSKTGRW